MLNNRKRITLSQQFLHGKRLYALILLLSVNCMINELYSLSELDIIRYRDPLSSD